MLTRFLNLMLALAMGVTPDSRWNEPARASTAPTSPGVALHGRHVDAAANFIGPNGQSADMIWQSDVQVRSFEVIPTTPGGAISARVTIAAGNDAARAVRLEILLPIGVEVLRLAAGCRLSPGPVKSLNARISCALGNLTGRATRSVSVLTSAAPRDRPSRFAVFAFSDTPDPVPANNFAERVLP